jgi:hypothetical protein
VSARHWQSIPAYLAGQEEELPTCENCGRKVDDDGEIVRLNEADWCADCSEAYGLQHHDLYVNRDRWWAKGGHCLCPECAVPRHELCDFCQDARVARHNAALCFSCEQYLSHDLAPERRTIEAKRADDAARAAAHVAWLQTMPEARIGNIRRA